MVERLDEERLETLRDWGAGLSTSARDELRAAGKAILMLVDEIDRLEADLWNARAAANQRAATAATVPPQEPQVPTPDPSQTLALTLSERIARGRVPSEPAT